MTEDRSTTPDGAGPQDTESRPGLLDQMRTLRRQARAARHAYWFPLVLFGLLTVASVPFYLQPPFAQSPAAAGPSAPGSTVPGPPLPYLGGSPGLVHSYLGYYWLVALLGGLLLTQLWYRWHARRVGLQTSARGYLITTAVLTALALAIPPLSLLRSPHWLRFLHRLQLLWPGDLVIRGTFPFMIIAVGLLVLAWAERSRMLAVTGVAYFGAALLASLYDVSNLTSRLGWTPPPSEQAVPNVLLPALVLLIAGTAACAAQWRHRTAA